MGLGNTMALPCPALCSVLMSWSLQVPHDLAVPWLSWTPEQVCVGRDVCPGRRDSKHLNVVDLMMAMNWGGTYLAAGSPRHGEGTCALVPWGLRGLWAHLLLFEVWDGGLLLPWVWTSISQ